MTPRGAAPSSDSGTSGIPELLAPAGSPDAFRAAVMAGADAIYLSGRQFGARKFAANFTDEEMETAVTFAHTRGVRVYVTVNTVIHDRELPSVTEYLVRLWSIGVDAVLVQDAGLASLAREIVPQLALHASTQMTIHNTGGVRWAHGMGFRRVVLARELSLDAVESIAAATRDTGVGLEIFAHGALCYCYSGQCLLSSVVGGRSGNRGTCAQPCRKPYTLVTGGQDESGSPEQLREVRTRGQYLLSPRDLRTYQRLRELAGSPVVSLKIEGRMKSPEYVAIVVSTYRKALDAIAAGEWTPSAEAERDLLLAFNRGFSSGYLFGGRDEGVMGRGTPGNRGLFIGRVTRYDRASRSVTVRLDGTFAPVTGDGILIHIPGPDDRETGFSLNNTPVSRGAGLISFAVPESTPEGAEVFVTFSRDLAARARQIIGNPKGEFIRTIPIDIEARVDPDGSLELRGNLSNARGAGITIVHRTEPIFIPARSPGRGISPDQLKIQLEKTGGTQFVVRHCAISLEGDRFAPQSAINQARRDLLAKAGDAMAASLRPGTDEVGDKRKQLMAIRHGFPATGNRTYLPGENTPPALTVIADSVGSVKAAVGAGCRVIWYEPGFGGPCIPGARQQDGDLLPAGFSEAVQICRESGCRFVWKFPRITDDRYLTAIIPVARKAFAVGVVDVMADTVGTAWTLRQEIPGLVLHGSAGLNIFNHASVQLYRDMFSELTLSPELSSDEIGILVAAARARGKDPGLVMIVQGSIESVISEDCLASAFPAGPGQTPAGGPAGFGIRDETGRIFPVYTDSQCRTHIMNAVETCLIDHLPEILNWGIDGIVIDARGRPPGYTGAMTRIYTAALAAAQKSHGEAANDLDRLKEEAKGISRGGITAGHFLRGTSG